MSAVELEGGGAGRALAWENGVLVLELPRAFAPGAPIAFSLAHEGGALALAGKTIGSKRQGERFEVRLRPINLRREERAALDALRLGAARPG